MLALYNIAIKIYTFLIRINSLFNNKAKRWVQGRENIFLDLKFALGNEKNIFWFHCASLGEYEQAQEVIVATKKQYPKYKILLTFFSPSGYEVMKNCSLVEWVFYLPSDTVENSDKFISIVKPKKVFFIKSELWLNYMIHLYNQNIPLYHIASVFRKDQFLLRISIFRTTLKKSKYFFVQDINSLKVLNNININNASAIGDTRFDSIISNLKSYKNTDIFKFKNKKPLIILGSVWPHDINIIREFISCFKDYKFIIAPHELSYCPIILKEFNGFLFSKIKEENDVQDKNLLVIDNIGFLKHLYQYSELVYIGGGFGDGVHNTIEPAVYIQPVIFGPNYNKSIENAELISINAAISINSKKNLKIKIEKLINSFRKKELSKYINKKSGAVKRILEILIKIED